jgi:hypothetical protein
MMIMVVPGNIEIARGSDQLIDAQLVGFDSPNVLLHRRLSESSPWNSTTMEPNPRGSTFRYLLVDVQNSQQYYVESKGVRSPVFSLEVVEKARVETIDLTYNFPEYTGMSPQTVEGEGDIAALKGTGMEVRVRLGIPVESARLLFDDQSTLDLSKNGDRDFAGSFTLERSGSYVVEVTETRWGTHTASAEYEIDVIEDEAPKVTITRPMRDVRATNLEEVFTEVKAEDDIGIGRLELRYSVNGASEKAVGLYRGKSADSSITASHTFFLEEFDLEPGDLVSYYAKAWDSNNATGPETSSSDIYFIQIRPFEQKYYQRQQQGMQGNQGGESDEALSRQQKEIISATFKLIREKDRMESKEYTDSLKSLALVQSRLQTQTQGLVDRLQRREAAQAGIDFKKLEEYLKNAVGEMEKAAVNLGARQPDNALPEEQKSLQQLMRAESLFREIQVSFAAQGGGASGSQANAEDLADLFELELNKLKNQYETVQRAEREERDQKVDEALERLKELAQRQQQLNERNRMPAPQGAASGASGSSGNQSQQQLMEQAEQLRRQLQKLSRERSSPQLNEASNRIEQAIEEMKKALKDSQNRDGAEAGAQGLRALQQLNDAVRRLASGQQAAIEEALEQAVKESGRLVEQQEKIERELDRLAEQMAPPESLDEAMERSEDLVSRKNTLADQLNNLEENIRNLSRQARKTEKSASNSLSNAAGTIQDRRLQERIRAGNMLIQNGFYETQQQREEFIREGLEEVQEQLEAAQGSLGESEEGKIEEAANRARQLSEGLEAMERRLSEIQRAQGGSAESLQAQQSQQGQQGQGQQGQQQGEGQRQGQDQGRDQDGRQGRSGQMAQNGRNMQPSQGQNSRNREGGMPSPEVGVRELSDNAMGPPTGVGRYRESQVRQLNRDLEERLTDARDLRRLMNRNSTQMLNLERVIDALLRSRDYPDYGNAEQVDLLKAAIENMRQVELDLVRDLERLKQVEEYFIAGDNEAPESYRKLVEEYYKSLAKSK